MFGNIVSSVTSVILLYSASVSGENEKRNQDLIGLAEPFGQFWTDLLNLGINSVVVKDDALYMSQLRRLQRNAAILEEFSDDSRSWRDDRKYLMELVDPHKYCFVKDVTSIQLNSTILNSFADKSDSDASNMFQLLPAEIYSSPISSHVSIKSYINNLHPKTYKKLYRSIGEVIQVSLPFFARVLMSLEKNPSTEPINLSGRKLQFIVGMKNVNLPPNSSYEGSSWHKEGLKNEHIVASAIYYYNVHNIPNSKLAFRVQRDADQKNYTYFIPVSAQTNRLVVFPNIYEHIVQPFELGDNSKPGTREIITLFLVNPSVKILSTADVLPQQESWKDVSNRKQGKISGLAGLLDLGPDSTCCSMSNETAKKYYLLASEERKNHVTNVKTKRHTCHFD